jgi:hypothetical protein
MAKEGRKKKKNDKTRVDEAKKKRVHNKKKETKESGKRMDLPAASFHLSLPTGRGERRRRRRAHCP